MTRRLFAVIVAVLLMSVASMDRYTDASQRRISAILAFETSLVTLDVLDDSNESGSPSRAIDWSPREKISAKLMLSSSVRKIKLTPPGAELFEHAYYFSIGLQDPFRFQEVFRI